MSAGTAGQSALRAWLTGPQGWRTTHFWGPVANWGFVIAGAIDSQKPPEQLSPSMTAVMAVYSSLFMRFAWMVKPRNYLLLACHTSNVSVQTFNLARWGAAQDWSKGTLPVLQSALPPSLGGPEKRTQPVKKE